MPETNEPRLDHMMAALRDHASGVHGSFDADALASAGRRRVRRRRLVLGGAMSGALVLVLGSGVWGLATWANRQPDQTSVADATRSPTQTTAEIAPVEVTVDTSGWSTYSSPEFPVTFRYPPDWTVGGSGGESAGSPYGCDVVVNCGLSVAPPPSSDLASVELFRNGFGGASMVQLPPYAELEVLGSVPGLTGWGLDGEHQDGPRQVVVVRSENEWGVDYSLAVAGSAVTSLALGDQNPGPDHFERAFSFSTNVENSGGESSGEATPTLIAILASVQPNSDFAPTEPDADGAGGHVILGYDAMSTPNMGAVTPDPSWKTYTSAAGNVKVRYPSTWTVDDSAVDDGVVWIVAPSGYIVDLLTNGSGHRRCDQESGPSEVLGTVEQAQPQSKTGTGPAQIRWINGGEFPVWIGLTHSDGPGCYLTGLGFGGDEVYLGSADNGENPTPEELDQAAAILTSARRAS